MAHMIDQTTRSNGAAYFADKPAWHGLGVVVEGARTSAEAMQLAGLDWQVIQLPKYAEIADDDGVRHYVSLPGKANVRSDNFSLLGEVGDGYEVFSNADAFSVLDGSVAAGETRYESAGALWEGKRVWALARLPKDMEIVKGDTIQNYLLCATGHDGSFALHIMPTSVRVVCHNTLSLALNAKDAKGISIKHTSSMKERVKRVKEALGLASRQAEEFQHVAQALAKVSLSRTAVQDYFQTIYPAPKAPSKAKAATVNTDGAALLDSILSAQSARAELARDLIAADRDESDRAAKRHAALLDTLMDNWHNRRNNLPGMVGSAWGALNAVTEYVDHQRSTRGEDDADRASNRAHSILWGSGADIKQQALSAAVALVR